MEEFLRWQFITLHIEETVDHFAIVVADFNETYELIIDNIFNCFSADTGIKLGESYHRTQYDLCALIKDLKYRFHRKGFEFYHTIQLS